MTTTTELLVPSWRHMLRALSAWLDKAAADRSPEAAEALLSARLAPDMFPLATQVRFACVQVHEAVARLRGEAFPPVVGEMLDEGRGAGEAPSTLAQAQARIAETLALIDALAPDALDGDPARPTEHALPMGLVFDFTAEIYARDWALPQFTFHLMTAYAILRAQGVALGKGDFVSHLLAHVRPGTMPGGAG